MKNTVLRSALLTAALLLVVGGLTHALAQDEGPGSTGPQPGATAVPIDGGASLLLAAGAAFGLRRLRKNRPS